MRAKVNQRTPRHRGRVFELFTENVTLENGVTTDIDLLRHPGASAIVPMPDADTVILIHQYRHAVGESIWEIPAGTLEDGEAPLACARRELTEETGFSAQDWQKLGETIPVPGYSNERIHLFLARELTEARQQLDADEMLAVHPMPFDKAVAMVFSGEIVDGKTVTSLLLAQQWRKKA